ncbi:MAG: peptide chain release factor N(5)-glutamine methyltransferase [Candidatus Acidiferrales bacterium]
MPHATPGLKALQLRDALLEGAARLAAAAVPSATFAAELLLMHAAGCDRTFLYAHPEHLLSAEQRAQFLALIERCAAGVPTQYLTGKQEFWGLEFQVTPDVLIPRPETEHVVEAALERLGGARRNKPLRVADVGTGSGCIAVALAKELPSATIHATDVSGAALEIARRNAARHGVEDRVSFVECNLLEGVAEPAQFDLIVSNPPYIGTRESESLPREVRDHEPHDALFAGEDGMALYPPLIAQAAARLAPGGLLILELGINQFEAVGDLLDAARGWTRVSAKQDLAGIVRVISAVRD